MYIKIDYFSDTNIKPSAEMLEYMMKAEVGNEVACEDPTVNLLLEKSCEILGKEAAIFLPTGTMANAIAYRTHCSRPGDIVVLDENSHPLRVQSGSIAGLAHATPYPVSGERGIFSKEDIEPLVRRGKGRNLPRIRLVSIEQTTNFGGGDIWLQESLEDMADFCRTHEIFMHLDGARLFNASVATGISVRDYCKYFDTVYIDFAKGLGAPIGAMLAGSKEFIEQAWYYKFQQGGAMHQSGILAAACIYALDNNIDKLIDDHKKAKMLAEGLNSIPYVNINREIFQTNIIYFQLQNTKYNPQEFVTALLNYGIRMLAVDDRIRAITHMDISSSDIQETVQVISQILR